MTTDTPQARGMQVPPAVAQDSAHALERMNAYLGAAGKHPTRTTRARLTVRHHDGTSTHWSLRRPMTIDEVRRETVDAAWPCLDGFDDCGRRVDCEVPSLWQRLRSMLT